jgi:hypothetical protein
MKTKVLLIVVLLGNLMLQSVQAEDVLTRKKVFQDWVNLEDSYMKSDKFAVLIQDDYNVTGIDIYNEDFTLYKSISLSNLVSGSTSIMEFESQKLGDKTYFLTQTLFNNDDLIECIVQGDDFFAIVNENGEVLFKENIIPSYVCLLETTSYTYLSIETENDDFSTEYKVYLINKSGQSNIPALTQVKSFSYPNPAKESINIAYNLQGAASGVVKINSLSGRLIDRKTVTGDATSLNYSTHRLASGTYIVSVETDGKQLSSEKITIK